MVNTPFQKFLKNTFETQRHATFGFFALYTLDFTVSLQKIEFSRFSNIKGGQCSTFSIFHGLLEFFIDKRTADSYLKHQNAYIFPEIFIPFGRGQQSCV
jgi:hypothetical protein